MLTPTADTQHTHANAAQRKHTPVQDLAKKDVFLKLLVAELQFQDPLNPRDPTQMSSQLAQFTSLEQQLKTNRLLEQFLQKQGGLGAGGLAAEASLLGKHALVRTDALFFDGTNPVRFSVHAPKAVQVRVFLQDANGNAVRSFTLAVPPSGEVKIAWDGTTDAGGSAAAGRYKIVVQAEDAAGKSVNAEVRLRGLIEAVRPNDKGAMQLRVAGVDVPEHAVYEITL